MKTEDMMSAFEAYYGETYSGVFGAIVREYLDTIDNHLRQVLFSIIIRKYSRRWGKAPDVATIEEHIDSAIEEMNSPKTNLIEYREELTEEEREEVIRILENAKNTPEGRLLLGILGSDKNGQ
jgi:hypothetical protein